MDQRWTLHVENFGKIKQADIEISPLMLFVGDNNSGKSYLMSLLWGLLTIGSDMFSFKNCNLNSYIRCDTWLVENIGVEVEIKDDKLDMFIDWFNDLLKINKNKLTSQIFNYSIDIGKIEIRNYKRRQPLKIQWEEDAPGLLGLLSIQLRDGLNTIKFSYNSRRKYTTEERFEMLAHICWELFMEEIAASFSSGRSIEDPVYLPASRTGFMLSYKSLVRDAISRSFSQNVNKVQNNSIFTLPVNYFLQDISGFEINKRSKYRNIADFIEKNMLNGKIVVDDMPVSNIAFKAEDLKESMPLYVTSSVVSELAPLVLLLKSSLKYNLLIIEEPEAHLHPKYQVLIAKAMIRLINAGLPVWITTHSDIILQQINNMIKLNKHSSKETLMSKFNYEEKDLLDEDKVNVYQFSTLSDDKTEIQKLEKGEYGVVVPTFNEMLAELLEETKAFQED